MGKHGGSGVTHKDKIRCDGKGSFFKRINFHSPLIIFNKRSAAWLHIDRNYGVFSFICADKWINYPENYFLRLFVFHLDKRGPTGTFNP